MLTALLAVAPAAELDGWLGDYMTNDRVWQVAVLEERAAHLAVERAQDRWGLSATASPGVTVTDTRLSLGPTSTTRAGWSASAALVGDDPIGGRSVLSVSNDSGVDALNNPTLTTVASLQYSAPLVRNALGRLYQLEADYLAITREARELERIARQVDRCTQGMGLYTDLWRMEAYEGVWDDLLARKQKALEQTEVDYNRRMVPRLDVLTARSDMVDTRGRHRTWQQQRASTLATLQTWIPGLATTELGEPTALDGPMPSADAVGAALESHPLVRSQELVAQATRGQADLTRRQFLPEVALVPNAGVSYTDGIVEPTTGTKLNTRAMFVGVALDVTAPLRPPTRRYDLESLALRAEQSELQAWEQDRALRERYARARETIAELVDRQALNAEKATLLEGQLSEAARQYQDGRLQYQDYVQHWVAFENTRFETIDLAWALYNQRIEVVRILGQVPASCEVL